MGKTVNPNTLEIGQYVKFSCMHPTDQQTYEGKIVGVGYYDTVKHTEPDLIPYYREVAKVITDLPVITALRYYTIEYTQGGETLRTVRAAEWIDAGSLTLLDPSATFEIRIFNLNKEQHATEILNVLRERGIACKLAE